MKSLQGGLIGLFLALLLPTPAAADSTLPPSPHRGLEDPGKCTGCHAYHRGTRTPHEFVVAIPEKCWGCHSQKELGRSHPIGVDPRNAKEKIEVPDELPLEDGLVSCGSCHDPHMAYLSTTRAYRDQKATFVQMEDRQKISWYRTLFLLKSDPIKGFEPLCTACHKDF